MTFAPAEKRYQSSEGSSTTFKRINWMKLPIGVHTIRILEEPATKFYTHWIKRGSSGSSIKCLGDDECPICINNQRIRVERPDDFKDVAGYIPWQTRWFVNILDRTVVKTCTNEKCGLDNPIGDNGHYPSHCTKCSTSLLEITEASSNTVKVLSRGLQLFEEKLEPIALTIQDSEGNPLGITNFDVSLVVQQGNKKYPDISAVPQVQRNDKIEIEELELFDLDKAIITLEADEITQFQRGVSLKDLFAARRSQQEQVTVPVSVVMSEENIAEANTAVTNLLGNIGSDIDGLVS